MECTKHARGISRKNLDTLEYSSRQTRFVVYLSSYYIFPEPNYFYDLVLKLIKNANMLGENFPILKLNTILYHISSLDFGTNCSSLILCFEITPYENFVPSQMFVINEPSICTNFKY